MAYTIRILRGTIEITHETGASLSPYITSALYRSRNDVVANVPKQSHSKLGFKQLGETQLLFHVEEHNSGKSDDW